jgi:membrane-associated phospholipid phosphatase
LHLSLGASKPGAGEIGVRKFALPVYVIFQLVSSQATADGRASSGLPAQKIATGDLPFGDALGPSAAPAAAPIIDRAPSGKPLEWRWSRFTTADYLLTAAGGAMTLAAAVIKPASKAAFSGAILFDDAARDALRPGNIQTRYAFRDASDVGVSLAVTWPFFMDSLVTAWWYRGSRDVAQEMALIDLETFAVSGAVQGVTNVLVGRERPYGRDCGTSELPEAALDCQGSTRYRSFFSGHAAFSFTGAALVCMHHFKNELLGSPWDALSCAGGYVVAATTSTFRIVGDVHYASDALTGALVGTLIGYGVPFLHYRSVDVGIVHAGTMSLQLIPAADGVRILGVF